MSVSLEHTNPADLLSPEAQAWLNGTITRNREMFAGYTMNAAEGGAGDAGAADGGEGDQSGSEEGSQGSTDTGTDDKATEDGEDSDTEDKRVQKANREAQRYRTELRDLQAKVKGTDDLLSRLTKALTGDDGGKNTATPEQLAAQAEKASKDLAAAQRELAVFKAAHGAGANPAALLDSRSFVDSLADVDATDTDAITKAIKDAVKRNPSYRSTQGSASGGGEIDPGKAEGNAGPTKDEFNKMTYAERVALKNSNPSAYSRLNSGK